jgi:NAD(P)-dependent dehydrogenase (short-subunit alcohol dehydrogenase family)
MRSDVRGRLEGRVAVVVGGGQTPGEGVGNGRATAILFARAGARVLVVDRHIERAEDTAEAIVQEGGQASAFAADVSREAGCAALVAAAVERYGRLDVLHNNVGIGAGDGTPTAITEEGLERIQRVNLGSVVFACKHALPVMREQRSGVITNISSAAAVCSFPLVAYKTTKAAVNAYTQSLAIGNAPHGIRVNAIMPGLMNTPMAIEGYVARGRDREALVRERDGEVPLAGGMGDGWDVAHAALFLASDEARFVTGVVLPVDGGQAARIG